MYLQVVMMSFEEVDEHVREVVELQKKLNDTCAKNDFQAHHLEMEHADAMKLIVEVQCVCLCVYIHVYCMYLEHTLRIYVFLHVLHADAMKLIVEI